MSASMPSALFEALAAGTARERKRYWVARAADCRREGSTRQATLCVRYAREQSREYVRCMLKAREFYNETENDNAER